jgi:RNA polymerase sigma-70 factor (ECF subfamily)
MDDDWERIRRHAIDAREGSRQAWAELYRALRPRAVRFCRRALPAADSEDLAEDALLRVRLQLARYDPARALRPWFVQVMTHALIDELRRRRSRARREQPERAPESSAGAESACGHDAEASLLREESRGAVRRALARLPDRARLALVLRYYEELSYAEMALALGTTPEQVGVILHRARRELRRTLSPGPARGPEEDP